MEAIIKKDQLRAWIERIGERAQVFAPAFGEDNWEFTKVKPGADVELDHTNTVRPAKGFVFPQREVLYRFRIEPGKAPELTHTAPKVEPAVVFGVRPCDGRAMVRNDRVFACGFSDPYYEARRDQVTFVGLACAAPPSPNCFCTAVGGSPHSEDGLDALMTELDGRYHVKALTDKGKELLESGRTILQEPRAADKTEVRNAHAGALENPQRSIAAMEKVAEALRRNFNSPALGQAGASLHRLRRVHLSLPELPLLRHQRRGHRQSAADRRARQDLGQLPVPGLHHALVRP